MWRVADEVERIATPFEVPTGNVHKFDDPVSRIKEFFIRKVDIDKHGPVKLTSIGEYALFLG
jgi:hypothetical protein